MQRILIFIAFLWAINTTHGQQILAGTAGSGTIGTMHIQYTLGEMVAIETVQSPNAIVTQGFHQPFRLYVDVVESGLPVEMLQIYPNPTALQLTLSTETSAQQEMMVRLMDNSGRMVVEQNWLINPGQNQLNISLHEEPDGIYYLQLAELQSNRCGMWKVVKISH